MYPPLAWDHQKHSGITCQQGQVCTCMSHAHGLDIIYPVISCIQLNPENRINLLCALESCENTPEVLVNIFTEAAITGLDKINEQVLYKSLCAGRNMSIIVSTCICS